MYLDVSVLFITMERTIQENLMPNPMKGYFWVIPQLAKHIEFSIKRTLVVEESMHVIFYETNTSKEEKHVSYVDDLDTSPSTSKEIDEPIHQHDQEIQLEELQEKHKSIKIYQKSGELSRITQLTISLVTFQRSIY